ncbi:MAG: F0F1 ATP synthase subunit B [Eubacteriaceae bacterium]|nr:F0F1 ATP synthase subunit B [Eubacteriaceae bacterium]
MFEYAGLVGIDFKLLLATIINFIIFFLILRHFFYQKVKDMIVKRQEDIAADIAEAEHKKIAAKTLESEYEAKIAGIHEEEKTIIREANLEGQEQRKEIIAQAREDAKKIMDKAMRELSFEKKKAMNEVKSNIVELSLFATEKIIKKAVDKEQHEVMILDFIDKVGEAK